MLKKTNSSLYCLSKLRSFHVNQKMLQIFYLSVIHSILSFGITCWGGNLTQADVDKINRLIRKAGNIIGVDLDNFKLMLNFKTVNKMKCILKDISHPMFDNFKCLKSDKSDRYRVPKFRTKRYGNSFLPSAIRLFNSNVRKLRF